MMPLHVQIDVSAGTAIPHPLPFPPAHINSIQDDALGVVKAKLLHAADILKASDHLVGCSNPWPEEKVLFCPSPDFPSYVSGTPVVMNGTEV